jgi:hypothetical protein
MQKAFSTYVVSPVPIKSLLLMRIKEGYRVKQYGQSTQVRPGNGPYHSAEMYANFVISRSLPGL